MGRPRKCWTCKVGVVQGAYVRRSGPERWERVGELCLGCSTFRPATGTTKPAPGVEAGSRAGRAPDLD